jgi:glutamine synthetase
MNLVEAQAFFVKNEVKFVLAQFVDLHGCAKTKAVPVKHFESVLKGGAGFAGFAICGMGIEPHGPDYMAIGDLSTLSLVPWQPGFARIVCNGHTNGDPHGIDSRVVLLKQVERLKQRGWILNTGLEPEFSLLRKDEHGAIAPFDSSDTLAKPCYDYKSSTRTSAYLEELVAALQAVDIDVFQIDHEDANGQFEVNYTYSDCLKSADDFVLFKMAASEIAHKMGMICSFMPKPFANRPGNGMHMHMSLSDGQNNLFADKNDPRELGLSRLAYHFMAGLLAHAPAIAAICAPTVNSYKRLVVGGSVTGATWAPAYISYGNNNRSCMVRIPEGRIELRLPDGACNVYLAAAIIIAAGLDGVDRKLDPGEPQNYNLYELSAAQLAEKGIGVLPQTLDEAVSALEADHAMREALGPVADEFIKLKRCEWSDYMRHVSDWEVKNYLEFF